MDSHTLVKQAFKQFTPPKRQKISDWAEANFQLPETSAEPGSWTKSRAGYQQGILDAICEPGIQKVSLMCSAQIGKTIILLIVICYLIDLDPCSIMMTQPTTDMAEMFSKEKLSSAITNVKPVANKIVEKSRSASSTILMKMFAGGFLRLAGANSPSSLASMSIRAYFGDEIDKYPASAGKEGDPVKLAMQRTETFWNWLVFLVSTPSIKENSRIESEFEQSDQRRYFVPCPHCGHRQHLIWERFQYENKDTATAAAFGCESSHRRVLSGKLPTQKPTDRKRDRPKTRPTENATDPKRAAANPLGGVYYICESCQTPIAEKDKAEMIRQGQWQATAVAKDPKHIGFHINRFYSPWKGWVDLCLDYESSKDDHQKLQVFWNATLGLPFERVAGEKLDWQKLRDRGSQSNYQQGIVPQGGLILTAGVDVQADRLEVAIIAWGRGEESYVIQYEKILGDPLQPHVWLELVHLTSRSYQREDGASLKVRATCVDSGYLTQEVYHNVRKYRYLHWFAIKGQSGDKPLISTPSTQEINYKGEKIKRGIQLYKIGVDVAKETLYSRSNIETPGAKYLNFPNNLDGNWYEGFCGEVQVTKHKNGQPYMTWEKLAGVRNEPLDTFVYALAAANLAGMTRINWGNIERELGDQILSNLNDKEIRAARFMCEASHIKAADELVVLGDARSNTARRGQRKSRIRKR